MTTHPSSPSRIFCPDYPIPGVSSRDHRALIACLKGMAKAPQLRANDLSRDPELRAAAQATVDAYLFAAQMVDLVFSRYKGVAPQPTLYPENR